MIDTEALKERTDLVTLAERDTRLKKVSTSEYAGPCPKCGGEDRFHVTPTWWFCRQCHEKRGDAIEYLRWRDGLGFVDACKALGADVAPTGSVRQKSIAKANKRRRTEPTATPCAAWQDRARSFVAYAERELWASPEALAYLRGRGLDDATIQAARLGYNPKGRRDTGERWGLDADRLWIPQGWVLPAFSATCEADSALHYVKVRQLPGRDPRYLALKGSCKRHVVYGLDTVRGHSDVILVEGELNALTLAQALPGAMAVVSIGDAGNAPGPEALAVLATVRRWWLAFDPDAAGDKAREKLAETYRRARPLSWPWKDRGTKYDINDAYRDGEDLAAWIVPQIGPHDSDARATWLQRALARLDQKIIAAAPDVPQDLECAWEALFGALAIDDDTE